MATQDFEITTYGGKILNTEGKYLNYNINVVPKLAEVEITTNGTVYPGDGYCGLKQVTVNVTPSLQSKSITQNGTYSPDSGYDGFSQVVVNVSGGGGGGKQSQIIDRTVTSLTAEDFGNITKIGSYAFAECYQLTSVVMSNVIATMGAYAFRSCSELSNIILSAHLTNISGYGFSYCSSLTSITIPNTVRSISNYAFQNDSSLMEIHLNPTTPPTLSTNAFSGIPATCRFYVPTGYKSAYQTATNWATFFNETTGTRKDYLFEE